MKPVCRPLVYLSFSLATLATFSSVRAQSITTDGSLSTQVQSSDDLNFDITQGNRAGNNLFHSFGNFSVPNNGSAKFQNATDIVNIFGRVTGGKISNINGLIQAQGTANLFLINPKGIVFGPNASLNIGGSFFASTASSILFDGGVEFSATDTQSSPLLSVNMPIGLRFRDSPGSITNRSVAVDANTNTTVGLQVSPGKTLALVGGNVDILNGGIVNAPSARVEIGGLTEAGTIELENNDNNFQLNFPTNALLANVTLADDAVVEISPIDGRGDITVNANVFEARKGGRLFSLIGGTVDGGDVTVNSNEINISDIGQSGFSSGIYQQVLSNASGNTGKIIINTNSLSVSSGRIVNNVRNGGIGSANDVLISASEKVSFQGGALIDSSTYGFGNAGKVTIRGINGNLPQISFDGTGVFPNGTFPSGIFTNVASITSESTDTRISGNINITAQSLELTNSARISSSTYGFGNAGKISVAVNESINLANNSFIDSVIGTGAEGIGGDINIKAQSLSLNNGTEITSSIFGKGEAGNISVEVDDFINLTNSSYIQSSIFTESQGISGDIKLIGRSLNLTRGSQVSASVFREEPDRNQRGGIGKGGSLEISMTDFINVDGFNDRGFPSALLASAERGSTATQSKAAGDITITTSDFRIADGAIVKASTANSGDGGKITINARNFSAINGGKLAASTFKNGKAGDIKLNITDRITLTGVDSTLPQRLKLLEQQGIRGGQDQELQGPESSIVASTSPGSTGDGGNIFIDPKTVEILDGAKISTDSQGSGKPGNIDILVDELLLLRRGGTISTNSVRDTDGGNININTGVLVALPNENSDISANANRGNGGRIEINALGIFGIEPRDASTESSDITATGGTPESSGIITINNPEVDPSNGLVELPETVVDANKQIAQNPCQQGFGSEFVATGRGGLPPNPTQDLSSGALRVDLATPVTSKTTANNTTANQPKSTPTEKKIVPAQGWVFNSKGQVVLTAYDPTKVGVQRTGHKGLCRAK